MQAVSHRDRQSQSAPEGLHDVQHLVVIKRRQGAARGSALASSAAAKIGLPIIDSLHLGASLLKRDRRTLGEVVQSATASSGAAKAGSLLGDLATEKPRQLVGTDRGFRFRFGGTW
jgi:hypothetical protein